MSRQWCGECRSRQQIVDTFTESHYEPSGEQGYRVTELACGHYHQGKAVRIGAAPGAPTVAGSVANLQALMRPELWGAS